MNPRSSWTRPAAEALALAAGLAVLYLALFHAVDLRPRAAGALLLLGALLALALLGHRRAAELREERRRRYNMEVECDRLSRKLQESEARLQSLHGLLAMCSHCKSIRDGGGEWRALEEYLEQHFQAAFTHGVCPECLRVEYPGLFGEARG